MNKPPPIDIPLDQQRLAWNRWNTIAREGVLSNTSQRQAQEILQRLESLGSRRLNILDVGCGTGWMCEHLLNYGSVTGVDLADEVIQRARSRAPGVTFIAGSIFDAELPIGSFDVIVTLEVIAHVADQSAFVARLAGLLKPGGRLLLSTQNRPVLERWDEVGPPHPGQIRRWVDARQLRRLLAARFEAVVITSVVPVGNRGALRIINSPKLNRALQSALTADRIRRFKERMLLGHTLIASARTPRPLNR